MEFFIIVFLAMAGVGAVAVKNDADKRGYVKYGDVDTRIIQQTRQVVEETTVIKDWDN